MGNVRKVRDVAVYIEATFDPLVSNGREESLVRWFTSARSSFFGGLAQAEASSEADVVSHVLVTQEIDGPSHRLMNLSDQWSQFEEFLRGFPWWVDVRYSEGDIELVGVRARQLVTDGSIWQVSARLPMSRPDDPVQCGAMVEFLREALDVANPSFGRIELNDFDDYTNLDAALRRRLRASLRESREILRGYAWVTVCPPEILSQLGGVAELESSRAFHRVVSLQSGGVLLQASETLADYTNAVMQRVFSTLAPVLPRGEPSLDPAHPHLRFVSQDAASVR